MFYPAQTSLIPVQIALARFLGSNGLGSWFKLYPYWYQGTTPWRYLTGPIIPSLLVLGQKILGLEMFSVMWCLVVIFWLGGGIGMIKLVQELTQDSGLGDRKWKVEGGLLFVFGPIAPLLFSFSNGLSYISFAILPWVLWAYLKYLNQESKHNQTILTILMTFLLLVDVLFITKLGLAFIVVLLSFGFAKIEARIKKTLQIFLTPLLIVTLWHGVGFWYQVLIAPSFAGKAAFQVIFQVGKILPMALAVVTAIVSTKIFKPQRLITKFCFNWLFVFGFLTLLRFVADPDFVLDWMSYGLELQLGLTLLIVLLLEKRRDSIASLQNDRKKIILITVYLPAIAKAIAFVGGLFFFTLIFKSQVLDKLQPDITQSVEYQLGVKLKELMKPGETVLLSGSTAFWLNSFFDLKQVRGGVDQVSVDPHWRAGVWEIREGTEPEKSWQVLRDLKINWLVIHTDQSREYYHDFVNPDKFAKIKGLRKVFEQNGDIIYQVK